MSTNYNSVIILTGTGIKSDTKIIADLFLKKIPNVIQIGNGEIDIVNEDRNLLKETLLSVKTITPNLFEGRVLVYINMHGINVKDSHYVLINENRSVITSKSVFNIFANYIHNPIDIIFTACNGKGALLDVDVLPSNSRVMIFSDENKNSYFSNHASTFKDMLGIDDFSFDLFYDNYLAHLGQEESPIIVSPGQHIIDPFKVSENYLGKVISESSREYIHRSFADNICQDEACHLHIDLVMDSIENADSMMEFSNVGEKYSQAFVNISPWIKDNYPGLMDSCKIHNNGTKIMSSAKLPLIKEKIDQYFIKREIALEVDLSKLLSIFDDDDDDDDDSFDVLGGSDRGTYDIYSSALFFTNDKFPIPDYPDFGLVLGIINYLSEAESSVNPI